MKKNITPSFRGRACRESNPDLLQADARPRDAAAAGSGAQAQARTGTTPCHGCGLGG